MSGIKEMDLFETEIYTYFHQNWKHGNNNLILTERKFWIKKARSQNKIFYLLSARLPGLSASISSLIFYEV